MPFPPTCAHTQAVMATEAATAPGGAAELAIEGKTVKALHLLVLKRSFELFQANHGQPVPLDEDSQRIKLACKVGVGRGVGGLTTRCKAITHHARPPADPGADQG